MFAERENSGGTTYFEQWGRVVDEAGSGSRTHNYESGRVHQLEHQLGQALFHAGTQVNGADRCLTALILECVLIIMLQQDYWR